MGKRIYCSIPAIMDGRDDLIDDIKTGLIRLNSSISERHNRVSFSVWKNGERYSEEPLRESDVYMFVHQDNKFDFTVDSLPNGVKREFNVAHNMNKKMILIYRNRVGDLGYYDIKLDFGQIRGVPGSSRGLHDYIYKKAAQISYKVPDLEEKVLKEIVLNLGTDKRLLLTIK